MGKVWLEVEIIIKSITTFSLDIALKEKFYEKVPSNQRTKIIEQLLTNFLEDEK